MVDDIKKYESWPDLVTYTKEFKEWIWKLFRKVHARIGHVEEELAKVKENANVNYELVQDHEETNLVYKLMETNSDTEHGRIVFDPSSGIEVVVWEDIFID